jgi:hypothetical protein
MKQKILTVAVSTALAWHTQSMAETVQSSLELSGLLEVEASYEDADDGGNTSDLNVATVELTVGAVLNEWVNASTVLLWEDEGEGGDFNVDSALVTLGNEARSPVYFTAGLTVVPFGAFETMTVSDPLTLDLGETAETMGLVGYAAHGLSAGIYAFNGDTDEAGDKDNNIDNFGARLGYEMEAANSRFAGAIGYINDIAESDVIAETVGENSEGNAAGYAVNLSLGTGPFSLIGEYLAAGEDVQFGPNSVKPTAWNVEAGYTFNIAKMESTFALGYQGTDEAELFDLPEQRISAGLSLGILKDTSLSFEVMSDEAYNGDNANGVTIQLATGF